MTAPRNPAEEPAGADEPGPGGTPGPRFLSIKDVAAELAVGEPSVRGLISTGELPAFQIGGRGVWRVGRDDLEQYISAQYARTAETLNEPGQDPDETAEDQRRHRPSCCRA